MSMTAIEKIFARQSGRGEVKAGDFVTAEPDLILLNDVSGPFSFRQFAAMEALSVAYPERVVLVGDHFAPAADIEGAAALASLNDFASEQSIGKNYSIGMGGIEHTLLPELGLISPGQMIIGGDSHTCTYGAFGAMGSGMGSTDIAFMMATGKGWFRVPETIRFELTGTRQPFVAGKDVILQILRDLGVAGANYACMEFVGDGLGYLSMDDRMAICNMTTEGSAKTCIIPPDETTQSWAVEKGCSSDNAVYSDDDAEILATHKYDLGELEPLCAKPFSPANVSPVTEITGIRVDQVYIGNCANGTLTDLRQAAEIFKKHKVDRKVQCIIVPATQKIHKQAMAEGLMDIFIDAGAVIGPSTCGACSGQHLGVLGPDRTAVATINRNFRGRMGHATSKTYLSNAYVAASAAVTGTIIHPGEL